MATMINVYAIKSLSNVYDNIFCSWDAIKLAVLKPRRNNERIDGRWKDTKRHGGTTLLHQVEIHYYHFFIFYTLKPKDVETF